MKLNLGCGKRRMKGWTNVDHLLVKQEEGDVCSSVEDYIQSLSDNSVDVINARMIIEHLKHERLCEAMDNCFRILKPGGYMYIMVPCEDNAWSDPTHQSGFVDLWEVKCRTLRAFLVDKGKWPGTFAFCKANFNLVWSSKQWYLDSKKYFEIFKSTNPWLTTQIFERFFKHVIDSYCYWLQKPGETKILWSDWDKEISDSGLYPSGYYNTRH